jgi:hypothetical protein
MNTKILPHICGPWQPTCPRPPRPARGFKLCLARLLAAQQWATRSALLAAALLAAALTPPSAWADRYITLPEPPGDWREASALSPLIKYYANPTRDHHLRLFWIDAPAGAGAAALADWDAQLRAQDPEVTTLEHDPDHTLHSRHGVWGGVSFRGRAGFYFGFEAPGVGVYFLLSEGPAADAADLRALLIAAAATLTTL